MISVFFVCSTFGAAVETMYDEANIGLINGVSALPNGCEWVQASAEDRIATHVAGLEAYDVNGTWYVVGEVETAGGHAGFSAGYPVTN